MGGLLPTPGNSGRSDDFFASDVVEGCGFGSTVVTPFGFDFPADFPFPLPFAAAFALDFGVGAVALLHAASATF